MKKIAFVIRLFQDNYFHGGGEKIFFKLINKFVQHNYIVDIYCSQSNVSESPGINKITVVEKLYNHLDPEIMETFYDEVKRLISTENYDFVISENISPPIDITFLQGHSVTYRKNKLKGFFEAFLYNFRPVKSKRIKYEKKWLNQGYRKIFVLSNILKNDLIDNFNISEDKISVIYPGIDFQEIDKNINFKKPDEPVVFGLSAPGFKRKGGYVFLEALKILKKKNINFKAKIIYPKFHSNIWIKILVKLYGIQDNVEFLSFQKNMQGFYNSIDCLVMPSLEETFGLVALEAMSNRKPCIVSSYTGLSEIIKDNHNGFVFDMQTNPAKKLANKMSFVINNFNEINERIIDNGYNTAQIYTWDKTYNDLAEKLLKLN